MNRLAIVSLAAAAVLGTAGGVTLAATSGDDDSTGRDGASSSTPKGDAPSGTDQASDQASDPATGTEDKGLFYYADGAIHDGDQDVAVPTNVGEVVALQRVKGGWLLVEGTEDSSGDRVSIGTFVAKDGSDWRIGEWRGTWDLTLERDRVVYGNGISWKVADFASRKATPLDVIDGLGEELDFMTTSLPVPGVAVTEKGVLTGWEVDGETLVVQTETDHWSHELLALPRSIDVPITSADGSLAIASYDNPDASETNPVGSCLTGGRLDAVEQWWKQCETGPASEAPYSRDGSQLLVGRTTGDGPSPSGLEVIDPATGRLVHEFDPGGYRMGAEWADEAGTVITLTGRDDTTALSISRCVVRTAACTSVLKVEGNVVLGSST